MYTTLATLAEVKQRVDVKGSAHDDLLNALRSQVSVEIENVLGRLLGSQAHTEYYDGHGYQRLYLHNGPLISVTNVQFAAYSGTTTRIETLTLVEQAEYLIGGLQGELNLGVGWIELIGGAFLRGVRNYKIIYVAGFAVIPDDLVSYALDWIVAAYKGRETTGLQSRVVGENSVQPFSMSARRMQIKTQLGQYMLASSIL